MFMKRMKGTLTLAYDVSLKKFLTGGARVLDSNPGSAVHPIGSGRFDVESALRSLPKARL
jgi:hypothetical protein